MHAFFGDVPPIQHQGCCERHLASYQLHGCLSILCDNACSCLESNQQGSTLHTSAWKAGPFQGALAAQQWCPHAPLQAFSFQHIYRKHWVVQYASCAGECRAAT